MEQIQPPPPKAKKKMEFGVLDSFLGFITSEIIMKSVSERQRGK